MNLRSLPAHRRCGALWLFLAVLFAGSAIRAELPLETKQLLEKLSQFETEETARLEAAIAEKRAAVVKILNQQAADETKKGNIDGALAIRNQIVALGGEAGDGAMEASTGAPAAGWQIPEDAILHRGDYYKVYPLAQPISWEEARARCQSLGGELGWLDRNEDIAELRKWMQPTVDTHGHAPIWMGARKNENGEWVWLNGKPVASNFWSKESDSISGAEDDAMIRWIGSFQAAKPDSTRVIGFLCRWKR